MLRPHLCCTHCWHVALLQLDREKRGKALLEQTQGSEQATLEAARREAAAVGEALQRAKQTRDAALAELEQLKQAQVTNCQGGHVLVVEEVCWA